MSPYTRTGDRPEMTLDHRMGFLEGKVEALEQWMTRSKAEDSEWRDDVKSQIFNNSTMLAEINHKLSQSMGMLSALKVIAAVIGVACVPAVGWLLTHPWPFGK